MKHLLIILISILLLSSPVIGDNHKGETLYGWGECCDWVWKGFGDKEIQPKYQGDVKNGKPTGHGTLTTPYGGKYVGGWKNGRPQGQGINTSPDGTNYVGEFKDGKEWNGTGYKNGEIVVRFVNGKMINQ